MAENLAGVPDGGNTPTRCGCRPTCSIRVDGRGRRIAPLGLKNYGPQALQWRTTPLVIIAFDFRRGLRIRYVEPRPVLAAVPVVDDYGDL